MRSVVQKSLPDLKVVGPVTGSLLFGAFLIDPLRAMDRYFIRQGRALEFRQGWGPGRGRLVFVCAPEYNRHYLHDSVMVRTSLDWLWPITSRRREQRSMLDHPTRTYGPDHVAFNDVLDEHLSRTSINKQFEEIRSIALAEIGSWSHGVHDFYALARHLTQRVSFTILFGDHDTKSMCTYGEMLYEYHRTNWSPAAHLFPLSLPGTAYRKVFTQADALQSFLFAWMKGAPESAKTDTLCQALLQANAADGCPVSKARLAGTVGMPSWLSYETMATVLTWAAFLLALHPAILSDLVDELSAHAPIDELDSNKLSSLPLLDAVLKESMRLITPVPFVSFRVDGERGAAEKSSGKGPRIIIGSHLTHRLPEIYEAPDRFRPERWFSIKPSGYEYMPFGGGQRRCPGSWLAMTNLKVALAAMVTRFSLKVPAGARIDRSYAVVTMPKRGLPLEFAPLDRNGSARTNGSHSGSIFDLFTAEPQRPVRH